MCIRDSHYTFQQVRSIIGCGYIEYEEARDILIHRYKENIVQKHSGAEEKRKLLALLIHKPINEISEQEAENLSLIHIYTRGCHLRRRHRSGHRNSQKLPPPLPLRHLGLPPRNLPLEIGRAHV